MTAVPSPPLPEEAPAAGADTFAKAVVFRCVLDDQPGYLAPRSNQPRHLSCNHWVIHPGCRFSWVDGVPRGAAESAAFLSCEETDRVVWVPDRTGWHPFWLGAAYRELLADFRPGDRLPSGVPEHAVGTLRGANILVGARQRISSTTRLPAAVAKSVRSFGCNRYANISRLLHAFHIDALRKYYRRLIRCGGMCLGDTQTSSRYVSHNEPVSRFFHHQLTPALSQIIGEPVKPSYTYVVSYQGGSELEQHVDREQCEFSVSLLVDYPPERERDSPWPLCIESVAGTVSIRQTVGDAILFCGRELPHWRPRLPDGHASTSMLLHYVRESFTGPLD